jgi:hypothetical protein
VTPTPLELADTDRQPSRDDETIAAPDAAAWLRDPSKPTEPPDPPNRLAPLFEDFMTPEENEASWREALAIAAQLTERHSLKGRQ